MAVLKTFEKQPGEVQDFDFDFTDYIESMGELVGAGHTVEFEADDGITLGDESITNGVAKVWTSGGTHGFTYQITAKLTTAGGREHHGEIKVKVREV